MRIRLTLALSLLSIFSSFSVDAESISVSLAPSSPLKGSVTTEIKYRSPQGDFGEFVSSTNNIALGKTVSVSSTISGFPNIHQATYLTDGKYGNGRSWVGADGDKLPYVIIDLAEKQRIRAISLGRDRLGRFTDRNSGKFSLHVSDDQSTWRHITNSELELGAGQTVRVTLDYDIYAKYVRLTFQQSGAAVDEVEIFDTVPPRNIRFLVSADPQYDNAKDNLDATRTLKTMANLKFNNNDIMGIIIAGDLTQNARPYDEFDSYLMTLGNIFYDGGNINALGFTYDGIGNHDLTEPTFWQKAACISPLWKNTCVDPGEIKSDLIQRKRDTPTERSGINYSWTWGDITFVQLNVYPGPLEGSLDFLRTLIEKKRPDRLVLIHHYGFDSEMSTSWWTETEREVYWDVIEKTNVVGIFTGHYHNPPNPEYDFQRPASRTSGRNKIPAFISGAASNCRFLDVTINDKSMRVTPKDCDGDPREKSIDVQIP